MRERIRPLPMANRMAPHLQPDHMRVGIRQTKTLGSLKSSMGRVRLFPPAHLSPSLPADPKNLPTGGRDKAGMSRYKSLLPGKGNIVAVSRYKSLLPNKRYLESKSLNTLRLAPLVVRKLPIYLYVVDHLFR